MMVSQALQVLAYVYTGHLIDPFENLRESSQLLSDTRLRLIKEARFTCTACSCSTR